MPLTGKSFSRALDWLSLERNRTFLLVTLIVFASIWAIISYRGSSEVFQTTSHFTIESSGPIQPWPLFKGFALASIDRMHLEQIRSEKLRGYSGITLGHYQLHPYLFREFDEPRPWTLLDGDSDLLLSTLGRALANPMMLLAPVFTSLQQDPVYTEGFSLVPQQSEIKLLLRWPYRDVTEEQEARTFSFSLLALNARDLGYSAFAWDKASSENVDATDESRMRLLDGLIVKGEKYLYFPLSGYGSFKVKEGEKARVTFHLWREFENSSKHPDAIYTLYFEPVTATPQ